MKYIVVIADGMSDLPVEQLGGKTPMEAAEKPVIDGLARKSVAGMLKTVPDGMSPGSDIANLSIFGYDPKSFFSGRAPLEAVSMGINMEPDDVAFRCNLVNLRGDECNLTMNDYSAGHITTSEAAPFIDFLNEKLDVPGIAFYRGVSYRHIMIWKGGEWEMQLTPPHDIPDRDIQPHMPSGSGSGFIYSLMRQSMDLLKGCPLNEQRRKEGKKEVNSIWLWGQGRRPSMPTITEKYGLEGNVICAVDLIAGIGILAGLDRVNVDGATGYIDTNFEGKARAACDSLRKSDICFVHIEACDECSHEGSIEKKMRSIEYIDSRFMKPLLAGMEQFDDYRLLFVIDHPTSVAQKIHLARPVPFLIYQKSGPAEGVDAFTEKNCASTGLFLEQGYGIIDRLIKGDNA